VRRSSPFARYTTFFTQHGRHLVEPIKKHGNDLTNVTATSRHAPVSRVDPRALRYRSRRVPPLDPLPSMMLSATLLGAFSTTRQVPIMSLDLRHHRP
jgi:hypothetical protein